MIRWSRSARRACLAVAVLLLVQPRLAFCKPPIFIIPGWFMSSLIACFDPPPGSSKINTPLNAGQLEALLLQAAGSNSSKVDSVFFSEDDSNTSSSSSSSSLSLASAAADPAAAAGGAIEQQEAANSRQQQQQQQSQQLLRQSSGGPVSAATSNVTSAHVTASSAAAATAAAPGPLPLSGAPDSPTVDATPSPGAVEAAAAPTASSSLTQDPSIGSSTGKGAAAGPAGVASADNRAAAATAAVAAAAAAAGCPLVPFCNVSIWLPSAPLASLGTQCWKSLLQLTYSDSARTVTRPSFVNSSNVRVAVHRPGASGMRYPLFSLAGYTRLVDFIENQLHYTRGTDLFALPYDFRLDCDSLAASGQLRLMAAEVLKRVQRSGQKAILIAHSHGATVGLQLLQEPALKGKVQGYIALAPMFGGSIATLAARASGMYDYLLPSLTDELTAVLGGAGNVRQRMYSVTQGMPSVAQMMPYAEAFGPNTVAVTVASSNKTYSVGQLSSFLADIGEPRLASSYSQVHAATALLKAGPPPGVQSFCIYGTSSDTPLSLKYGRPLLAGQPNEQPSMAAVGKGDGVVNVESLRLCTRIASSPDHVTELTGVTHYSVYTKRTALKAIRKALAGMLAPSNG